MKKFTRIATAVAAVAVIAASSSVNAAAYIKFDGVDGESRYTTTDEQHKDWIIIQSLADENHNKWIDVESLGNGMDNPHRDWINL